MLSLENKHFSFRQTSYNMETYKTGSARQVFFTEFKIQNSFTLENSFFKKLTAEDKKVMNEVMSGSKEKFFAASEVKNGYDIKHSCHHFTTEDHMKLGRDLGYVFYKMLIKSEVNEQYIH